jgi:hypothetical protein
MSDIYTTAPKEIVNAFGVNPNNLFTKPSHFTMMPHFFYEFNGLKNVKYICLSPHLAKSVNSITAREISWYLKLFSQTDDLIVFDNLCEGNTGPVLDKIYQSVLLSGIDASRVYYINGAVNMRDYHQRYVIENNNNIIVIFDSDYEVKNLSTELLTFMVNDTIKYYFLYPLDTLVTAHLPEKLKDFIFKPNEIGFNIKVEYLKPSEKFFDLDEVLEKIEKTGFSSLSEDEKKFLDNFDM